jgi:hypothetical protein
MMWGKKRQTLPKDLLPSLEKAADIDGRIAEQVKPLTQPGWAPEMAMLGMVQTMGSVQTGQLITSASWVMNVGTSSIF